jgi:hypothetical protein
MVDAQRSSKHMKHVCTDALDCQAEHPTDANGAHRGFYVGPKNGGNSVGLEKGPVYCKY